MRIAVTTLSCLLALACASITAQPLPKDVARSVAKAREAAADELTALAASARRGKGVEIARRELAAALVIDPEHASARKALKDLAKKKHAPKPGFAKKLAPKRKAAYQACMKHLAKAALAAHKRRRPDAYEQLANLAAVHFAPKDVRKQFRAVWSEPGFRFVHTSDAKKLKKGHAWLDGKWLKASEIKALDEQHSSWDSPWVLADEVHELRTTLPYCTARRILAHVTAFRCYFLARFGGDWDLRPPKGKLPVIVTDTHAEMLLRLDALARGQPGTPRGAAFYLQTNESLNPCFVSLELVQGGRSIKMKVDEVSIPLQHEIAHQIAFEYSKFDYDRTRPIQHEFWCVEALANFLACLELKEGVWRLTRPRMVRIGGAYAEGDFAWCQKNLGGMPSLEDYRTIPRETFATHENYHIAATAAYFLLEGADGRYRNSFIDLLAEVHRVHESEKSFRKCFPKVDPSQLQGEWEQFVRGIKLDRR